MTTQETIDAVATIQSRTLTQSKPSVCSVDAVLRVECDMWAAEYVLANPHCTLTPRQLAAKLRAECREMLVAG